MAAPVGEVEGAEGRAQREVAQRVFAAEFNESKHSYKESGDRSPSFVVSPYGAKVNRLFAVGVLTRLEEAGTPGNYRAQVVDPTGTFYLWAGQYEPEAAAQIQTLQPPCIVAFVGKSRVRETDDGATYVNVRPERIVAAQKSDRDAWIVETAKHSKIRLDALREAQKLAQPTPEAIHALDVPKDVAEGVAKAVVHYGKADLGKYTSIIRDALESLLPGGSTERVAAEPEFAPASAPPTPAAKPAAPRAAAPPAESPHEPLILGFCESLDDGKGAPWEDIVAEAAKKGIPETAVEECLNALMDKGQIYEPVLGRLKRT